MRSYTGYESARELGRYSFSMELFGPHVRFVGAFPGLCPLLCFISVYHYYVHATRRIQINESLSLING